MKLIVGLGNPGLRYRDTRHNVGFMVAEGLADRWGVPLNREKFGSRFGEGEFGGCRAVLIEPLTYMNRSGEAVLAACGFYKLALEDLLVISDDLALPVGRIRLRGEGSSGGQKGLGDIELRLGTSAYPRLRIGIGPAGFDAVDFVLSRFDKRELQMLEQVRIRAAEAVECWMTEGIGQAMTRFNRPPADSEENE